MGLHFDEKGKYFTDIVRKIPVPAIIQTITHRIRGDIYIRHDERILDTLNAKHATNDNQFISVTDAVVYDDQDQILYATHFIALLREKIVWIIPEDELDKSDSQSMLTEQKENHGRS